MAVATGPGREIVLFADTFNRYFERENIDAALAVLGAAGYRVEIAKPKANGNARPLCCGRTFLAVGKVGEARHEAERAVDALTPFVKRGLPIVGLEPSCVERKPCGSTLISHLSVFLTKFAGPEVLISLPVLGLGKTEGIFR